MKLFCNLTDQSFAASLRDRSQPFVFLTQDNQEPVDLYPVRPTFDVRWPFQSDVFDPGTIESPVVTLINPGDLLPLTSPALLTPIRNGFTGIIDLATTELGAFLGTRPERYAILSVDGVVATLQRTFFRGSLLVRARAIAGAPTSSYELSGVGELLAISAAGTTDLAPAADFIQWFQLVNVTPAGAPFTHKLTIDSARALPGARFVIEINIPAAAFPPTIQIFDNSISSALLDTIDGDTDNAVNYRFEAVLVANSWQKDNGEFLS